MQEKDILSAQLCCAIFQFISLSTFIILILILLTIPMKSGRDFSKSELSLVLFITFGLFECLYSSICAFEDIAVVMIELVFSLVWVMFMKWECTRRGIFNGCVSPLYHPPRFPHVARKPRNLSVYKFQFNDDLYFMRSPGVILTKQHNVMDESVMKVVEPTSRLYKVHTYMQAIKKSLPKSPRFGLLRKSPLKKMKSVSVVSMFKRGKEFVKNRSRSL